MGKNHKTVNSFVSSIFVLSILFSILTISTSIVATPAFAFENYLLSAPFSPVTVAACTQTTEILQLINAGDEAAKISLSFADKDVEKIVTMQTSNDFLTPGQSTQITLTINAPCKTSGTYDYAINLQGNSQTQTFDRQLIINKINNIDFTATNGNLIKSCPCVAQKVPFTITNTGTWAESYIISAKGNEAYVATPAGSILLGPGQTFSGAAFTSFSCQTYGEKNFDIQVEATASGYKASIPFTYQIDACYDYSFGTQQYVSICEQDSQEIGAIINNSAAYTNTFKVKASLPYFSSLAGNEVTLLPHQIGFVPVQVSPKYGDAGNYSYSLQSKSTLGNFQATANGMLNIQKCYDYSITPQTSSKDPTKFDVCAPGEYIEFEIKNNGERTQEMHVKSSESRFTLNQDLFNLSPSQSKKITLFVPSLGIEQKMSFDISVWSSSNTNVIASNTITLQPYDLKTCFGVEVSPVKFTVNNSITNLAVTLTSKGIRGSNYSLSLENNGVNNWTYLVEKSVFINAKESKEITIVASAPLYLENTSYNTNLVINTPYSTQSTRLSIRLNPNDKSIFWWIIILLLIALLVRIIMFMVKELNRNRPIHVSRRQISPQPRKSVFSTVIKAEKTAPTKDAKVKSKSTSKSSKYTETQTQGVRGWLHLLIIIIIVAVLLGILITLLIKGAYLQATIAQNTTKVTPNQSTIYGNDSTISITYPTNQTLNITNLSKPVNITNNATANITSNLTSNITTPTIITNISLNVSQEKNETQPTSAWRKFLEFLSTFKLFSSMSITTNITANISASNLTNVTQPLLNISPNISTNYSGNITSNITTNITANLSSNLSNITSNQTNTTIVANLTNVTTQVNTTSNLTTNDSSMSTYSQRVLDLVVAKRFLAENENSTRVFVIYENSTASINLSHYFIDLDNLSLKFELQPVNASKMTSVIDKDLLTLAPQESFVGLQTFRISATNSANLSTLSPLLTLIVLDEMPSQPLSRSIQIGLLVLLIIIAIIIYFDIRLISKQYTHAKQTQDEHKKKK